MNILLHIFLRVRHEDTCIFLPTTVYAEFERSASEDAIIEKVSSQLGRNVSQILRFFEAPIVIAPIHLRSQLHWTIHASSLDKVIRNRYAVGTLQYYDGFHAQNEACHQRFVSIYESLKKRCKNELLRIQRSAPLWLSSPIRWERGQQVAYTN